MQLKVDLPQLFFIGDAPVPDQIFKRHVARVIAIQRFFERILVEIEYVGLWQRAGAVIPVFAVVGIAAALRNVDLRLRIPFQHVGGSLQKSRHVPFLKGQPKGNVRHLKKLFRAQGTVEHVFVVDRDEVCTCHMNAAVLQHEFLIRHVRQIDGFVRVRGALHLIDRPAAPLFPEVFQKKSITLRLKKPCGSCKAAETLI